MQITFYDFNGDNLYLDKSPYLSNAKTRDVKLLDETDIYTPSFKLEASIGLTSTYAYIPAWGRYYYMKPSTSILIGNFRQYTLTQDDRMTYRDSIRQGYGIVERYENGGNFLIQDNRMVFQTNKQITPIKGGGFSEREPKFLLTVAGGQVNE